jgi:hypothetical protein
MATATMTTMLTDDQAGEILKHLLDSGGPAAVADMVGALAKLEGDAAYWASIFADWRANSGRPYQIRHTTHQIAGTIRGFCDEARAIRGRLAALAKMGSAEAAAAVDPGGFPDAPSATAEAHLCLIAGAGQPYVDQIRRELAGNAEGVRLKLGETLTNLDNHRAGASAPNPGLTAHSAAHTHHAALVTARDGLKARLAVLDDLAAKVPKVQGSRVADAVKAAGGADAVATGIREARIVAGTWWSTDPAYPDVQAKVAAVASLDGRLKATVAAQVASAIAGDEPARAAIEALARMQPRAFQAGFADALQQAQFEWSPDGPSALDALLGSAAS